MDGSRLVSGAVEVRTANDGPNLYGVMLTEGRAASGGRRELFAPGSVEWPSAGVGILLAHRQAPEVRAVATREDGGRITVQAPATPAIREAVDSGRRFMSVEFHALKERTTAGGVREVLRAFVPDVALVRDPEYDTTEAEVRRRLGPSLRSRIATGRRMDCRCGRKAGEREVSSISFETDAFVRVIEEVKAGRKKVSAIGRGAGDVIADTPTGSLGLRVAGGALAVTVEPLGTEAGETGGGAGRERRSSVRPAHDRLRRKRVHD